MIVFWGVAPKAKATKGKINKEYRIKLKSFCITKEANNKMKRKPMEWQRIFVKHMPDKG